MLAGRKTMLLLALALSACAKSRDPSAPSAVPARSLVAVEPVASLEIAKQSLEGATLRCADAANCPANVGLLLAADAAGGLDPSSDAVLGCTASLVGPDLALTNSHCIPSAVKLLPDLCATRVRLVLPAAGDFPEESFACAQLLGVSARETATSPDLALLRLAHATTRASLALDRGGVEAGSTLLSYRVDPDLKRRTGRLVAEPCAAIAASYRMPLFKGATDPVVVTGECAARPGNSGSPLLGSDGKLRAVLQAELPIEGALLDLWKPHLDADAFAPLAMGTSLGCLAQDPALGWKWNDACGTISEADVAAARPRLRDLLDTDAYTREAESLLLPFRGQSPLLDWRRENGKISALEATGSLVPACARGTSGEVEVEIPRYSISVRFNRYAQLAPPRAELLESRPANYGLSPAADGGTQVEASDGTAFHLAACPRGNAQLAP